LTTLRHDTSLVDEVWLSNAVAAANTNALRMALYQSTGDASLVQMQVQSVADRGGAYMISSLRDEDAAVVREKALAFLAEGAVPLQRPEAADLEVMLTSFEGRELGPNELELGMEQLALTAFPRAVDWKQVPSEQVRESVRVAIVGAGIGGIAMAIQLERLQIPYTIYERQGAVGGTWAANTYPEARVDVTSFLYQYSFVKKYPWAHHYASREEMADYLEGVAERYGIRKHIQLNAEVVAGEWDAETSSWRVTVRYEDGVEEVANAPILISASGLFNKFKLPAISGLDDFKGEIVHTAQWVSDFDPTGRRVALIGNGSSGSQLMPHLARTSGHLTVFQRTPQWIAPLDNYHGKVGEGLQWLLQNFPHYWNWHCYASYAMTNNAQFMNNIDEDWIAGGGLISQRNDAMRVFLTGFIKDKLKDRPDLIDKSIPDYAPTARRLVIDNGWYDALLRDNVTLVANSIDHITEDSIIDASGDATVVDALVLASGFEVERYLWPVDYVGRDGATLSELWAPDGPRSYLGITLPNFPNFFMMFGPNGQPRTGGYHMWSEIWTRYIARAIVRLVEEGAKSIEVRRAVFDKYNKMQDAEHGRLILQTEGRHGYAVSAHQRDVNHIPWITWDYAAMLMNPSDDDFQLS